MDFALALSDYLAPDNKMVQEIMTESLRSGINILDAANGHIMEHQGKRLRSKLLMLFFRALEGRLSDRARKIAAASEILHNATLLHDDVADESTVRRGAPTVSALLGSKSAVLLGDFWLVKSMDLIIEIDGDDRFFTKLFSTTLEDLARGELLELQKAETCDTSEKDYLDIIYYKTASLFEACCKAGAACAGASKEQIKAAGEFGVNLGMAFQIKDDIMDYSSDNIGKPVGLDLSEKKITLPLLCVLNEMSPEESDDLRRILREDESGKAVSRIRETVDRNCGVAKATVILENYVESARKALDILPQGPAKDLLDGLASYVSYRKI